MEQFVIDASIPTSYELKFAPHHNVLAAMSGRDVQIFEMRKEENGGGFVQKFKLRSFYVDDQNLKIRFVLMLVKKDIKSGTGYR